MIDGLNKFNGIDTVVNIINGCLIVSLQGDLNNVTLQKIRNDTLTVMHSANAKHLIFDMNAVHVLDIYAFHHIADTIRMARYLSSDSAFVGFQPGVVSFLVDMNIDVDDIAVFRKLEDALDYYTANQIINTDNIDDMFSNIDNNDEIEEE